MAERHEFQLFADYFQFYVQDEEADGDLSDAWTKQAVRDLVAIVPGCIGVGTMRNMDVDAEIDLADGEPDDDLAPYDQVVDCGITVPSGRLVVAGCTDYFPEAARIAVPPGTYRVRAFFSGFDTISDDGLAGDDRYRLVLWPGDETSVRVLKRSPIAEAQVED